MTHNNPNLSEMELVNDIISTEKQMLSSYSTFIAEATCPNLRQELNKIITDTQQTQFNFFNAAESKGWYPIKNAKLQEVQQAVQKYQQMKNQL